MPMVNFISIRMKPAKKKYIRTRYDVLSKAKGVEAVVGVLSKKGPLGGKTEIQAYRLDVRKGWTLAKAKKWAKDKGLKPIKIEGIQKGKEAEKKRKATKERKPIGESKSCPPGRKGKKKMKKKRMAETEFDEIMKRSLAKKKAG